MKWLTGSVLASVRSVAPAVTIVKVVAAATALIIAVWLLSHIALTVDALKNVYVAIGYVVVLLGLFAAVAVWIWLQLRPRAARRRTLPTTPPRPGVEDRLDAIYEKQGWEQSRPVPQRISVSAASDHCGPQTIAVAVVGPERAGKSALIAALTESGGGPEATHVMRLIEQPALAADRASADAVAATIAAMDAVLFVTDGDLRATDMAALERVVASRKPVYVALCKADRLSAADRDAVLEAIRRRIPRSLAPSQVVAVAAAPVAVEREVVDAHGHTSIQMRQPPPDLAALTDLMARVIDAGGSARLQFATG
jgi:GTP-binding protein EngB required for normal cell division